MGRAGGGGGHSSGGHSSSHSSGGHHVGGGGGHRAGSGGFSGSGGYHGGGFDGGPRGSRGPYGGPYDRPRRHGYGYRSGAGGFGLFSRVRLRTILLILFVTCAIFSCMETSAEYKTSSATVTSTKNREKITGVAPFDSDCVTDELGWFDNAGSAGKRLKEFYTKTGIQPYVYLNSYGSALSTDSQKEAYADTLFDELGLPENAFLYVYFAEKDQDNDVGYMCYVSGNQAEAIMDDEAVEIFWNYIDRYWYSSLSTDEMFEKVFLGTGTTIMKKTTNIADVLKYFVIGATVIAGLGLVVLILKIKRENEAKKAAETERILRTPMQDLVDGSDNDPLVNKYKE